MLKPYPMAKKSNASAPPVQIEQNNHRSQTRLNNPPIGLVDENESVGAAKRTYAYDPHIDPELKFDPQHVAIENLIEDALASNNIEQMRSALEDLKSRQAPYLAWAGKAERTTFDIPTVSLHTHEHIDARRVMQAVRKRGLGVQGDLFAQPDLPLGEALEFYKHAQNWQNRLIAGDSLLVMNSLLEKEAMAGGVQMIYFDPPYGIRYQSNFQPFTDKRDVIDGNDQDLSTEPEMIKAFETLGNLASIHTSPICATACFLLRSYFLKVEVFSYKFQKKISTGLSAF